MEATSNPTTTQPAAYVVTDDMRDAPRLHVAGCADIARRGERIIGEGATPEAAAIDAHIDFINEGSMTADEALGHCHVIACAR